MEHLSTLSTLVNMGFPKAKAQQALSIKNNDVEAAMEWLLSPESEDRMEESEDPVFP